MLTDNLTEPKSAELLDLDKIRSNLKRWAATAKETGLWADLSDEELGRRLEKISHIKRFLEKYCVDRQFREEFSKDPCLTIERYKLRVDPEDFQTLSEIDRVQELSRVPIPKNVKHYLDFSQERLDWAELKEISSCSSNPYFKAWRERQIARTQFQFNEIFYKKLVHVPVCFELSKGCSVGCYFCGLSAPRLGDNFLYTQENSSLWREVLKLIREMLGTAASAGFCYWATDPLDNPDYEKFMTDFHEILEVFPQTTTAQPLKDLNRLRSLLKLALEKGCKLNRFSILSSKTLDRVYEEFSAEELAFVGIVPQTPGARVLIQFPFKTRPTNSASAGRLLERNSKKVDDSDGNSFNGTIACVTGFLFNMVERSVKLISPCDANQRWPLGYITFDESTFSDIDELREIITNMIAKNMSITVRNNDLLRFRYDLEYGIMNDGFKLSTKWRTLSCRNHLTSANIPDFRKLGEMIVKGDKTAGEIADILAEDGISQEKTLEYLNAFLKRGVLDDQN